jgi:nucleoside-diphosphate-sugar epimerase
MMRIFLAGSTGVLGRRLIPLLVKAGYGVTALTRRPGALSAVRAAGAEPVVANALDRDSLIAAVASAAPDVILHQLTDLGTGNSDSNAALRVQGTRNLVDAALASGIRRIVAQSISWAYEGGDTPANERADLDLGAAGPH